MLRFIFLVFFSSTSLFADETISLSLNWQGGIVIFLLAAVLFVLIKEYYPPDITLIVAGTIPFILGILPKDEYLNSFANQTLVTIGMLFIVARAFEKTGILTSITTKLLTSKKTVTNDLLHLLFPVAGISAFMNNIPLVIMLMPELRRWAIMEGKSPSKYLLPISYATILGGTCTLIGTSTNIVVSYFLEDFFPGAGFSFFEIGKVGFFCALFGGLYLILFSDRLIPRREDPKLFIGSLIQEVVGEFEVRESLANLSIKDFSQKYLSKAVVVIAIERLGQMVLSPSLDMMVLEKDRLIFCGDRDEIAKLSSLNGLTPVDKTHFHLENSPSHFSEMVIPLDSILIGKTLSKIQYRNRFGGSVFALFREGKPFFSNIQDISLKGGDVLMVLSAKPRDQRNIPRSKDLFFISDNQEIGYFSKAKCYFVFGIIIGMIGFATYGFSIMLCSSVAAIVFVLGKLVSPRDVLERVNWNLIILIAGGLALAKSIEVTNIAHLFAHTFISIVGNHPHLLILTVFLITLLLTELVTNVASALIILPIALGTVDLSSPGAFTHIKAIGIAVAIGASCSFLTPIGYQTNTIIYGPGGYRFSDYFRVGIFLSVIIAILVTTLVPYFWQIG